MMDLKIIPQKKSKQVNLGECGDTGKDILGRKIEIFLGEKNI